MNAGRVAPILNAAPLVWLGDISYSLYLAHGFVQFLTTELLVGAGVQNTKNLPLVFELAVASARHARRYVADGRVHSQGSRDRRPHSLAEAFECMARKIECDVSGKADSRRRGINAENELIDAQ
jgi:hypothetical protein